MEQRNRWKSPTLHVKLKICKFEYIIDKEISSFLIQNTSEKRLQILSHQASILPVFMCYHCDPPSIKSAIWKVLSRSVNSYLCTSLVSHNFNKWYAIRLQIMIFSYLRELMWPAHKNVIWLADRTMDIPVGCNIATAFRVSDWGRENEEWTDRDCDRDAGSGPRRCGRIRAHSQMEEQLRCYHC